MLMVPTYSWIYDTYYTANNKIYYFHYLQLRRVPAVEPKISATCDCFAREEAQW